MRIGFGNDLHRLEDGEKLILGGIEISFKTGSVGHSDGDALLHAVTDAVLGALALGDIGTHFPDHDDRWKDSDSSIFLAEAARLAREMGFEIVNVDSTISIERPKLRPYIDEMRANVADALGVEIESVNVKAKTGEGLGEIGNGLAVKAEAVVLLDSKSD
ncbi:MAG: 2-C-methyl-D-erythritol 2,4-cyclodiphosphate synthase [Acidobacteria bacterium]|nr:MAG: 2-C-methyl-D-erythritol 2,4-cyclodiphosphate synthase [Acidobacteriota bacterium]REK02238.1 MAG: 2-C-methyl-D-erythritol 2,4-cyclodiphosphate synthase [Acidobacteriota bacterium]REK13959.1 MAG: 2-C-methyl-D-erythritol 2,4-cyclodiphosphate synthase [Acidobacteriota bacterium]REK41954.1 MAG: 2-C-methyl-D-erythritol 2,4-cyclodiphosphate synthase [Acidobacteriota bacterium]